MERSREKVKKTFFVTGYIGCQNKNINEKSNVCHKFCGSSAGFPLFFLLGGETTKSVSSERMGRNSQSN